MFNIFGNNKEVEEALANGATVIDVRSKQEFAGGNVKGSYNIPVDKVGNSIPKIKKMGTPIVLCCASGMRSALAKSVLTNAGITDVYDGKTWSKVARMLNN